VYNKISIGSRSEIGRFRLIEIALLRVTSARSNFMQIPFRDLASYVTKINGTERQTASGEIVFANYRALRPSKVCNC